MPAKRIKKASTQLNLILLGDPGAGKATQGGYFAKKYDMYDHDMGRELTLLRQKDRAFDSVQKHTADRGMLTPTKIVRSINERIVLGLPRSKAILFDGHPKMVGEARLIAKYLKQTKRHDPLVLYLRIPQSEIIKRIQKRKGYYKTKYNKRADDSIQALRNRARYYRKNITEVLNFFKSKYKFQYIDGLGTRAEVRQRIQNAIDNYLQESLDNHG
jgi:adenylate kinase